MRTYTLWVTTAVATFVMPTFAWAQHEAHQGSAPQPPSGELAQCLRVQPVIANIITAAMGRAEAARLSNSPPDMRAAIESLEAALRDIRAQAAPCSTAAASTDPHASNTVPTRPSSGSAQSAQPSGAVPDPHAGHTMPSAAAATKTAPAAPKPEGSKAADPHGGHSSGQPDGKQVDPVNGLTVDPATAPKATYQGHTYYFSSEQSRKAFLKNPAKFAKKSKK
jgi:YHS domain-containing protein